MRDNKAGGGVAGLLGERTGYADGRWADPRPMSPGTRADYRPDQGHRERVGGPPGGGDPGMKYKAPPVNVPVVDINGTDKTSFIETIKQKAKKVLKPTKIGFDERNLNYMIMKDLLKRKNMKDPSLSLMANVNPYGLFNYDAFGTPYLDESETEPFAGGLMYDHSDFFGGNLSAAAVRDIKGDPRYQIMYQKSFADGGIAGMLGERTGYKNGEDVTAADISRKEKLA